MFIQFSPVPPSYAMLLCVAERKRGSAAFLLEEEICVVCSV